MRSSDANNSSEVAIIGAGGHTRSLISGILQSGYLISGIYDESFQDGSNEQIMGIPLVGKTDQIPHDLPIIISVGNLVKRFQLYQTFQSRLLKANIIHDSAQIFEAKMGFANQLFASALLNNEVHIRDHNILNTRSILEHEVSIGSHNHISVGAIICGRVRIGSHCFIGAGTVINDKISICDHVTIGSNSTVIRDISEPGVYAGSPCQRVK